MTDANPIATDAPTFEAPKIEGERIHVTSVDRFLECGFRDTQYRTRAWQEPHHEGAVRGHGVHAAREHALKEVLKARPLPSVEECEDRADTAVHEELKDTQGVPELDAEADKIASEARLYAKADRLGILPDLAPHVIAVEEKIEWEIEDASLTGKYVLTGRPDAVARSPIGGRLEIPDLKTSKYAPTSAAVNVSTQHSLYSALGEFRYGERPAHSIHHIRLLKTQPRSPLSETQRLIPLGEDGSAVVTMIPTDRTDDDVQAALRRLRFVLDAREQGYAPPAPASFMSPCFRCEHRGHRDPSQRCPFVPATRAGEQKEESDE